MFQKTANPFVVAMETEDVRAVFIRRTYLHLAGAILAFVAIEAALFSIPGIEERVFGLLSTSRFSWLIVLGAFMLVSWIADRWAHSATSLGVQYAGLALYVAAEALIFLPLLLYAAGVAGDFSLIMKAGVITLGLFAGLTAVAFTTKKDFTFLGGFLKVGFFVALAIIVLGIFGNFDLGLWFSAAMVVLAGGSILFSTSKIIHHYQTTQYVAASLGLFASVALLFWYVLRIVIALGGRD